MSWPLCEICGTDLAQVPESNKANAEAYRLLRFLRYFNYIPTEELPGTSLLREFLGEEASSTR